MRCMMMVAMVLSAVWANSPVHAREWHDASGDYEFEADLVAATHDQAVLKREDGRLVVLELSHLSPADQEFVAKETATQARNPSTLQTWTMRGGLKVPGRIVGYGRKEVVVQRRRGMVYVNDRLLDNLPEIYQRMLPRIVSHFEDLDLKTKQDLVDWAVKQKGQARKFVCDGVMLELENGDEYAVPFLFFSAEDLEVLQPGWDRWLATHEDAQQRERENFLLEAQAKAYQRDRQTKGQIATMQLMMSAVEAGVTDLWEVALHPRPGVAARSHVVVVPARNSQQAVTMALSKNPGFVAGPARRLN